MSFVLDEGLYIENYFPKEKDFIDTDSQTENQSLDNNISKSASSQLRSMSFDTRTHV